ncbi:MAG: NADH-quinone oxidoreductase subunit H, partial [Proteobacteria bacterium]|nr:NADH-quinone oxidoreductase subunit H [Pseudomonadota bacterium]
MNQTVVSFLSEYAFFDFLTNIFGENSILLTTIIFLAFAGVFVAIAATIGGLGTYAERKISADIQMRIGPNRVGPYGLLQFLADGVKMIAKEDIMPRTADKFLFYLAPVLCLVGVFATLAVFPVSSGFTLVDLNVGVFFLIAISSLVGLGVFLGGYASNSKWSMLGGMRGASQIISYEIPVTLSVLTITLIAGSMSFGDIVSK